MNIQIVRLNRHLTARVPEDRNLFRCALELSEVPTSEWVEAFAASRSQPRHPEWRKVLVQREHIVLECPLDELQSQVVEIVVDIGHANAAGAAIASAREPSILSVPDPDRLAVNRAAANLYIPRARQ